MNQKTLGGGALLVAGAFLGREFLIWGYNKILDAVGAGVRGGISFVNLSWQDGIALALVLIGLTLVLWPKPKKSTPHTENYNHLYNGASNIISRIRRHRTTKWFMREQLEPVDDIVRAGNAVLISFAKAGFIIPKFDVRYSEQLAVGQESYFAEVIQLLGHGHVAEARISSTAASERAQSRASS